MNLHLRIRTRAGEKLVGVWLVRSDGGKDGVAAESGLLYGELLPATAEALAEALGLRVEREAVGLDLFGDEA